jgi:hypothetical protein
MSSDEKRAKMTDSTSKKKPYHKPQLEIYGDIESITQHVGTTGNPDSPATPGKNKSKA